MRKRRRGLSFGSVLAILLTAMAIFGTYYFLKTVASDSPASAMDLTQIVEAFGKPFQATNGVQQTPILEATSVPSTGSTAAP